MTHEELSELYELYALGVLEPEERTELEQHLSRNCPQCTAGLRSALAMTAMFGAGSEMVEPPRRLRKRVLASLGLEPRWRSLWIGSWGLATAGLCAALAVMVTQNKSRLDQIAELRSELTRQIEQSGADRAKLLAGLKMLSEPDTEQVVFGKGTPQPPRGRVFVNASRGVLLMASNLPPAPPGKAYEMWIVPKTGAPIPAGMFQPDSGGFVLYLRPEPVDRSAAKAVAVTLEPASGSTAPTSTPLIAAALSD